MKIFDTLRPLIRIAAALERIATCEEAKLSMRQDERTPRRKVGKVGPESFVVDTLDPRAADKRYRTQLAETGYPFSEDDG